MEEDMASANTIVIKIGTSSLMSDSGTALDMQVLSSLAEDIAQLHMQGKKVAIVTSGAVGLGMVSGNAKVEGRDVQVAARIGQPKLMHAYIGLFERHGLQVGQLLLTQREFATASLVQEKVVRPIRDDFSAGIIPIINENDAITDKETTLGDNDSLSAEIACAIGADVLIMLSVKNGNMAGRGGREAKEKAIGRAGDAGVQVLLVDGKESHCVSKAFGGDASGRRNADDLKNSARKESGTIGRRITA